MGKRLKRCDWINGGLKSLSTAGFKSLRAGPLAQELGVSRGSFYWHFIDMAEFELQLMNAWKQLTTESVITELESDASPESRLTKLVRLALSNELNLDKAMRSWSMEDKRANSIVADVDNERIIYVESLLEAIGLDKQEVTLRARVLYWSCVGRSVVEDDPKSPLHKIDIKRLIKMFVS